MRQRIAFITLVLLLVAFVSLVVMSEPILPDRLATHFGPGGSPNGWMSRDAFVRFEIFIVVVPVVIMYAVGFLASSLPPSLINLPNRDYWLAEGRRAATVRKLRLSMFELGNATLAFLLFVVWSIIDANKEGPAELGGLFKYGLFAFLVFIAVWTFLLLRPFLTVPE